MTVSGHPRIPGVLHLTDDGQRIEAPYEPPPDMTRSGQLPQSEIDRGSSPIYPRRRKITQLHCIGGALTVLNRQSGRSHGRGLLLIRLEIDPGLSPAIPEPADRRSAEATISVINEDGFQNNSIYFQLPGTSVERKTHALNVAAGWSLQDRPPQNSDILRLSTIKIYAKGVDPGFVQIPPVCLCVLRRRDQL